MINQSQAYVNNLHRFNIGLYQDKQSTIQVCYY